MKLLQLMGHLQLMGLLPLMRIFILAGIYCRDEDPSYHKGVDEKIKLKLKMELRELELLECCSGSGIVIKYT